MSNLGEIASCYEDERCPDCGENIPLNTQEGEECLNCGHVFWLIYDSEPNLGE